MWNLKCRSKNQRGERRRDACTEKPGLIIAMQLRKSLQWLVGIQQRESVIGCSHQAGTIDRIWISDQATNLKFRSFSWSSLLLDVKTTAGWFLRSSIYPQLVWNKTLIKNKIKATVKLCCLRHKPFSLRPLNADVLFEFWAQLWVIFWDEAKTCSLVLLLKSIWRVNKSGAEIGLLLKLTEQPTL